MKRLLTILLLAVSTAYGQIDNPSVITSLTDLTVKSINTSEPVTWALDAVQTASDGPTSFRLVLPDNANVLRLTNNYPISDISNGRLGAFYYLINESGSPITINNTNGITVQGGTDLTLAPNQAATLVATGATNASVAARGDLNDVTLGGTLNIAPAQTADSADSLMTRSLSDARYSFSRWYTGYELLSLDSTTGGLKTLNSGNGGGGIFDNQMVAIPDANTKFNLPVDWRISGQVKIVSYWTDRGATNSGGTNADIAVWSTPFARSATNNSALPFGVNGTQVQTVFTANYGGAARAYVVEQTMDFSTVSGINATNPLQVKFVEIQRRAGDATDTSTNTIWLSGVHVYVP